MTAGLGYEQLLQAVHHLAVPSLADQNEFGVHCAKWAAWQHTMYLCIGVSDLAFLTEAGSDRLVGWLVACIVQAFKLICCFLQLQIWFGREQHALGARGIAQAHA